MRPDRSSAKCSLAARWKVSLLFLALSLLNNTQLRAAPSEQPMNVQPPANDSERALTPAMLARAADSEFFEFLTRGLGHYTAGHYRDAIEDLKRAYRIHPFPRILLNIGQAHRKLDEPREARQFLSMYLALDSSLELDKRQRISQILVELEQKIAKPVLPPIVPARPRWRLGVGIAATTLGALALGFGVPAVSIDGRCIQAPTFPGEVCAQRYDTQTLGITLTAGGVALALGGLLLATWPARHAERGASSSGGRRGRMTLSSKSVGLSMSHQ